MSYQRPSAYGQGVATREQVAPYHTQRLTFHAGNGQFGKQKKDDEGNYISGEYENIALPTFVVLDDSMFKVVGEASSPMQQAGKPVAVFKDGKAIAKGAWRDISTEVKAEGGKYAVQCFVLYEKEVCLMPIKGSFLKAYIDYCNEHKIKPTGGYRFKVTGLEKKQGKATYFVPQLSHETFAEAYEANEEKVLQGITKRWDELQSYFEEYFAAEEAYQAQFRKEETTETFPEPNHQDVEIPETVAAEQGTEEEDDLPF